MLVRYDPFRDVDRLMEQLAAPARRARSFPMDAIRRGDEVLLWLDLPGVDPESIDVTVERNVLTVRAQRRFEEQEGDQIIATERPQGEFTRELILGDTLDTGKMEATYENGVLQVTMPVAEQAKPRRIQVSGGDQPQTIEGRES